MSLLADCEALRWSNVPARAVADFRKTAGVAARVQARAETLPKMVDSRVFWEPNSRELLLSVGDAAEKDEIEAWKSAMAEIEGVESVQVCDECPGPEGWIKVAYSVTARKLQEGLNLAEGTYPGGIPNHPGPLSSMLTGGMLGAGLGYGAGWLGEKLLPDQWKRNRLRRTLAVLGGLAGALPGAAVMAHNWNAGKPLNDNAVLMGKPVAQGPRTPGALPKHPSLLKAGDWNESGYAFPPVPVNEFNHVVWNDPRVSDPLPPAIQAAATGLMTGAQETSGRELPWVTPSDIGRMAAGMGSGYISGALVGKALGLLMGMPVETQEKLKNTGMWAGVVKSLIPIVFGG